MEKRLLHTPGLEKKGEIGPFYYSEAMCLVTTTLLTLSISIFVFKIILGINSKLVYKAPIYFFLVSIIAGWVLKRKDPWYPYYLISHLFLQPKTLSPVEPIGRRYNQEQKIDYGKREQAAMR